MNAPIADVLSGRAQWSLIHADNAEVLPMLGDRSVDHVITDPPYGSAIYKRMRFSHGAFNRPGDMVALESMGNGSIGDIDAILDSVALEIGRLCSRWALVFSDVESGDKWRTALVEGGLEFIRSGAWVKPFPMPQFSGDRPAQGFELATIAHAPGKKRWNGGGHAAVWTHAHVMASHGDERFGHPCPKPLPLMLELVELFTDPGDLILDPFAGSGTTGVACIRLRRRFIGIEKDETFAGVARERLQAESQGLSLRAARAGQLALFQGA